jgi:[protein-PII] uridylyltransferase
MTLVEADVKPRKPNFALKTADVLMDELDTILGSEAPKSVAARALVLAHMRKTLQEARASAEAELLALGKGTRCAQNLSAAQDEIITAVYRLWSRGDRGFGRGRIWARHSGARQRHRSAVHPAL